MLPNEPDGSDPFIPGVDGDGGRLPQGFIKANTPSGKANDAFTEAFAGSRAPQLDPQEVSNEDQKGDAARINRAIKGAGTVS